MHTCAECERARKYTPRGLTRGRHVPRVLLHPHPSRPNLAFTLASLTLLFRFPPRLDYVGIPPPQRLLPLRLFSTSSVPFYTFFSYISTSLGSFLGYSTLDLIRTAIYNL